MASARRRYCTFARNLPPDLGGVTLSAPDDQCGIASLRIAFPQDPAAAEWFIVYFQQRIIVRHSRNGYPDDAIANGPTIISTASLEAVCRWFPSVDLNE